MSDVFVLTDIEQVRAIADPLRQRILELMIEAPVTTKQVAEKINEQPTKLYHHVEILEQVGLVKLVETRPKRGTVEKYYQAVADSFTVDRGLFASRPQTDEHVKMMLDVVSGMIETTMAELRASAAAKLIKPEDPKSPTRLSRTLVRTSPAKIARFHKKMDQLLKEFERADSEDGELAYGLTIAFYPIVQDKPKKGKKK